MASITLSLCSSLTAQCRISQKPQYPPSSNPNFSFLSISSHKLPLSYARPTFPFLLKSSESEAVVVEAETDASEPEDSTDAPKSDVKAIFEASAVPGPKREEVFAVVMVGSRQYIVFPGRFIYTQRLKGADVNDKITLNKVLLVGTRNSTYIGTPVVTNAAVHAVVEEQGLDSKVVVFKYKRKKNYRRNIGHRQPRTRIRITGITGYEDYPAVTLESQGSLGSSIS